MSKGKLQTALDEFVQAIVSIAEDTAQDTLAARAQGLRTVRHSGRKPMAAKPKTKRRSMSRPCPIVECKGTGAPRYGMMCKEHSGIDKAETNAIRFAARQPGGKWSDSAPPKKAAKRTKKKTAKRTKKKTAKAATA